MVEASELLTLDRWIVGHTLDLQNELQQLYDSYQFHFAVQKIHNFCSETLGGFYLDVIKDRQYTTQSDSLARPILPDRNVSCSGSDDTLDCTDFESSPPTRYGKNMPGKREDLGVFTGGMVRGIVRVREQEY